MLLILQIGGLFLKVKGWKGEKVKRWLRLLKVKR